MSYVYHHLDGKSPGFSHLLIIEPFLNNHTWPGGGLHSLSSLTFISMLQQPGEGYMVDIFSCRWLIYLPRTNHEVCQFYHSPFNRFSNGCPQFDYQLGLMLSNESVTGVISV